MRVLGKSFGCLPGGWRSLKRGHKLRHRSSGRPEPRSHGAGDGSYRVEITGEPSYAVDIIPSSRNGDHNYAAIAGAAGRVVNAIPEVVAGPSGIRSTLDLPLITGQGLYAAPKDLAAN